MQRFEVKKKTFIQVGNVLFELNATAYLITATIFFVIFL